MGQRQLEILCVEDDSDIRHIIELSLSLTPSFSVRVAGTCEAAWEMLQLGLKPDIILLDDQLPGCSGIELATRIKATYPEGAPPVAFITAACLHKDLSRFEAAGAIGVICKPFDPITLADEVKEMMCGRVPFYLSI